MSTVYDILFFIFRQEIFQAYSQNHRSEELRAVLGHLKRSHKQGDRELADRLGSIEVEIVVDSAFTAGTRCYAILAKEGNIYETKLLGTTGTIISVGMSRLFFKSMAPRINRASVELHGYAPI